MTEQTLSTGTPGDQALYELVRKLADGGFLVAEPWADFFDTGGTLWTRWQVATAGGLFKREMQCGEVCDLSVDNPDVNPQERWEGYGLCIHSRSFPSRDEAMAYVDGELRDAGWVLP